MELAVVASKTEKQWKFFKRREKSCERSNERCKPEKNRFHYGKSGIFKATSTVIFDLKSVCVFSVAGRDFLLERKHLKCFLWIFINFFGERMTKLKNGFGEKGNFD